MPNPPPLRRLATVMFTDMVGYSALTQRDETLAIQVLGEHNRLLRSVFSKHHGREIKTIGDAFLVEFDSAVNAVKCAIETQGVLSDHNAVTALDRRIEVRIGLHLGEVLHANNDVFGDAVNVAARIEPLAEPGGICISSRVFEQVRGKVDTSFVTMGTPALKNIDEAVEVYRVVLPDAEQALPVAQASIIRERIGSRLSLYKVLQVLGEGGMGIVYLAAQEHPVRRKVALKIIRPGMDSKEVLARFESERQALAVMNHPNIATVFDAGSTHDGRPFFAMEYVAGVPITEYCDQYRLSLRERAGLFLQVCNAIEHSHSRGIIHRDVKPSNVMVCRDGDRVVVKVIDFGIAKATSQRLTEKTLFTQQGSFIGTLEYMSPEQAEAGAVGIDARTDVYGLGVLLYELVAGVLPFDPDRLRKASYTELCRILREEEPLRPSDRLLSPGVDGANLAQRRETSLRLLRRDLRSDLDWIALKAIEKDPSRRYSSASDLATDINRYLRSEPVLAGPPGVVYRLKKLATKNLRWTSALFAVFVVMVVRAPDLTPISLAELKCYDFLISKVRGPIDTPTDIVIVLMDERSEAAFASRMPWPRRVHAQLIETLDAARAQAVVFDVLFHGSSNPVDDTALAAAIRASKIPVVMASLVSEPSVEKVLPHLPHILFLEAGAKTGHVNGTLDRDGVMRRAKLAVKGELTLPTLLGKQPYLSRIPVLFDRDADPEVLVNYVGAGGSFQAISFVDALGERMRLPGGVFENKVVFVGAHFPGLGTLDYFRTPFGDMSGTEIQANVLNTFLRNNYISQSSLWEDLVVLILLGLLCSMLLLRSDSLWKNVTLSLAILVGYAAIAALLFVIFQHSICVASAAIVIMILLGTWVFAHQFGLNTPSEAKGNR